MQDFIAIQDFDFRIPHAYFSKHQGIEDNRRTKIGKSIVHETLRSNPERK